MALQRMPYLASVVFAMRFLNDPQSETFAVDVAWRCYIGFDSVTAHGDLWCAEALLHEAGHLFSQHAARATDLGIRRPDGRFQSVQLAKLANYASDCEINDDLLAAGCTSFRTDTPGPGGILPTYLGLPDNETFEFYFNRLRQKAGSGGGQGDEESTSSQGCGSGSGGLPSPGELASSDSMGGQSPGLDGDAQEAALNAAAVAITSHAKNRGDVPAGLLATAEQILVPPKVPWRNLFRALVRKGTRARPGDTDHSYTRPNRRRSSIMLSPGRKAIFPGSITQTPRVVLVRDTSGSMSDHDLAVVSAEAEALSRQVGVRDGDFKVIDVDAKAYGARSYKGRSTMLTVQGRGGTDMRVGIRAAAQVKPLPHVCVVVTDGYSPFDMEPVVGMVVVVAVVGCEQDDLARFSIPDWMHAVAVPTDET